MREKKWGRRSWRDEVGLLRFKIFMKVIIVHYHYMNIYYLFNLLWVGCGCRCDIQSPITKIIYKVNNENISFAKALIHIMSLLKNILYNECDNLLYHHLNLLYFQIFMKMLMVQ